jgi:MoxR-like ATPase
MQENRPVMNTSLDSFQLLVERAKFEIGKVVIGQEEAIDQALIVILSGQHALVEGVPGIAKTLLIRTLAHVLGCSYGRIQFTPDLMPADITGTNVFNLQRNEFTLVRGPIFTTFLLGDEINRAPAKTQSALLQAMQERAVSIDRETIPLSPDFTVFATQNPVEFEGTYPLPEAQKDRFMLKIPMSWPEREAEVALAGRMLGTNSPEASLESGEVEPVLAGELEALRSSVAGVVTRAELVQYVVDIVRATRNHDGILLGAGPRATQGLVLASRARAALNGRDFVTPDDVRSLGRPVLEHRLILRPESEVEGVLPGEIIEQIFSEVPVPR